MDYIPERADPGELRVILYSHDSQGLGHTRRNLAIADALATRLPALLHRRVTGLLLSGVGTVGFQCPASWDWVSLPGVDKHEGSYVPRHLDVRMPQLTALRAGLAEAAMVSFEPHLIIVDRHPYGVNGELGKALSQVRRTYPGCKVVLGLRDVLDSPEAAAREWHALGSLGRLREDFDEIWIYGDPDIHDPLATSEIPRALADRVRYTGYLSAGRPYAANPSTMEPPFLLTMAGGGSDGLAVTMAAARADVPQGYSHLIITGPQMPAAHRRDVERAAGPHTRVVSSVPDALTEIKAASAIVSMGGYNSICEILSTSVPALVIPRVHPRQEQLIRASAMQRHDLVTLCPPEQLSSEAVSEWFAAAAENEQNRSNVNLSGLTAVPRMAAELLSCGRKTIMPEREYTHAVI